MNKKINLSNRSIGLLQADNRKRFKGYVLGQRESEFQSYFAIWECFASCMEAKKKLWDYNTEVNFAEMEKKFKENNAPEEELANAMIAVTEALNNVQTLELPEPLEAEKEIIVPLTEKYNLKVRFDAFYWDYILDHKTVATFTPEEKVEEKYSQQMRLYQYARYKHQEKSCRSTFKRSRKRELLFLRNTAKRKISSHLCLQRNTQNSKLLQTSNDISEHTHSLSGAEKGLSLLGLMISFLRWKISSEERWSGLTTSRLYL